MASAETATLADSIAEKLFSVAVKSPDINLQKCSKYINPFEIRWHIFGHFSTNSGQTASNSTVWDTEHAESIPELILSAFSKFQDHQAASVFEIDVFETISVGLEIADVKAVLFAIDTESNYD